MFQPMVLESSSWIHKLLKYLIKEFMDQYKHNIKEHSKVKYLYFLHQGPNETMEKYIPHLNGLWKSKQSKLLKE